MKTFVATALVALSLISGAAAVSSSPTRPIRFAPVVERAAGRLIGRPSTFTNSSLKFTRSGDFP